MASRRSAAVVELDRRWSTVPAADHERTPRHDRASMDDYCDVIARLADRPRHRLAA